MSSGGNEAEGVIEAIAEIHLRAIDLYMRVSVYKPRLSALAKGACLAIGDIVEEE